jgi:DNA-binding transcriptional ArsR family regulator
MEQRKIISDPKAARVLASTEGRRFLEPFIQREVTLSQAAQELGVKLTTMHYHVRKLLRLGLLEVRREEPRKGRAVKIYGTAAEEFFVPFEVTPYDSLEVLLTELMGAPTHSLVENAARLLLESEEGLGLRVWRGEKGNVGASITPHADMDEQQFLNETFNPASPAMWLSAGRIHLEHAAAKELQRELYELAERYDTGRTQEQRYEFILGLIPVREP